MQIDYEPVAGPLGFASKYKWRIRIAIALGLAVAIVLVAILVIVPAFSSSSDTGTVPYVRPPVQSATPSGLVGSSSKRWIESVDPVTIKERFFEDGPTNMFTILNGTDARVASINSRISQFACFNSTTDFVNYTLNGWNETVEMTAQCADAWAETRNGTNVTIFTGFILFGLRNNTFYLYERSIETMVASILTLDPANHSVILTANVWYSVGLNNLNGSHAVARILADPVNGVLEMSTAGTGIGFCGAQLLSLNGTVYLAGSVDDGATCEAASTACVNASDVSVVASGCSTGFSLAGLGRKAYVGPDSTTLGASTYPGSNLITLRANGTDDTLFGPLVIPTGL